MSTLITVIHVVVCIFLMLTVLLQSGKGGMGAAFGGGGTQTVFGGAGAGSFLRKMTVAAAITFMLTSMTLAWLASRSGTDALKRYSAQQRHAAELKKKARTEALEANARDGGVADQATEDGDAGAGVADDGGAAMSVPGDEGASGADNGASAPEGATPSEAGEAATPPAEGAAGDSPPPIEPAAPAGEAEQPGSRAPPADSPTPG